MLYTNPNKNVGHKIIFKSIDLTHTQTHAHTHTYTCTGAARARIYIQTHIKLTFYCTLGFRQHVPAYAYTYVYLSEDCLSMLHKNNNKNNIHINNYRTRRYLNSATREAAYTRHKNSTTPDFGHKKPDGTERVARS